MVSINGPRTAGVPPVIYGPSGFWDKDYQEEVRPFNLKGLVDKEKGKLMPTTQKSCGYKLDDGKPQWSLLPLEPVQEIVSVLTCGLKKYPPENWKRVSDHRNRYFSAMMRHITAWWGGERNDLETGKSHLAHAGCCLLFLMWFDKETK